MPLPRERRHLPRLRGADDFLRLLPDVVTGLLRRLGHLLLLVRAVGPELHHPADCRRFAFVAQWIERLITDQAVGGSNPSRGTIFRAAVRDEMDS